MKGLKITSEHILALAVQDTRASLEVLAAQEVCKGDGNWVGRAWSNSLLNTLLWRWVWVLVSLRLTLPRLSLAWLWLTWLSSLLLLLLGLLLHAHHHGSSLLLGLLLETRHDGLNGDAFLGCLLGDFGIELCLGLDVEGLDLLHLLGGRLLAGLDLHSWRQRDAHRHATRWERHTAGRRRGSHRDRLCGVSSWC